MVIFESYFMTRVDVDRGLEVAKILPPNSGSPGWGFIFVGMFHLI